jgi:hypothetical protein
MPPEEHLMFTLGDPLTLNFDLYIEKTRRYSSSCPWFDV